MSGVLAIIPARGGSKGIPGKNLKVLSKLSLTARAVLTALNTPGVDKVVVSTDSEDIAAEARKYGAETPFLRPAELSGDMVTSHDMWKHAWEECEKAFGVKFDVSVLLEPTSPLRQPADITETLRILIHERADAAATVSETPAHYTPQKTLRIDEAGYLAFFSVEGSKHFLRQSIPSYYHRNGICYALYRKTLLERNTLIERCCRPVVIGREVVNIDTLHDLDYAEFLMDRYGDPLASLT